MPKVSRETASETVTTEGFDVRVEHLEGGYSGHAMTAGSGQR
jgi:hypothetical protein